MRAIGLGGDLFLPRVSERRSSRQQQNVPSFGRDVAPPGRLDGKTGLPVGLHLAALNHRRAEFHQCFLGLAIAEAISAGNGYATESRFSGSE